jgi:uncharacterized membrane protein
MLPQTIALGAAIAYALSSAFVSISACPQRRKNSSGTGNSLGYFIAGGTLESLGLRLVLYALSFGPVILVTPLTATLPLWVVLGGKIFLRDVEEITPRIMMGALLVVAGTVVMSLAKP